VLIPRIASTNPEEELGICGGIVDTIDAAKEWILQHASGMGLREIGMRKSTDVSKRAKNRKPLRWAHQVDHRRLLNSACTGEPSCRLVLVCLPQFIRLKDRRPRHVPRSIGIERVDFTIADPMAKLD
jgi:hypothetical protein